MNQEPRIVRPQEVKTIKRLKLEDALHLLEYEDPRRILLEADEFIND